MEFLLSRQFAYMLRNCLGLTFLLLIIGFPEPLVDLILFHIELFSELQAKFSRWHLTLVLIVDFPELAHLLRLLPVAMLYIFFLI